MEKRRSESVEGNLDIHGYKNLEKIIVKKNSLRNLNVLRIHKCEKLKSIEVEDGERWEKSGKWFSNGSFYNVKNVQIEST